MSYSNTTPESKTTNATRNTEQVTNAIREVLSLLVRRGTVNSWYLIARRVLQYQITIY